MHSHYDLAVIGTGPAGQKAAINAAKMGKRVVAIEREPAVGGACIRTGTIPSKAMREAVMHLTGYRMRGIYGASYLVKKDITMHDLIFRCEHVVRHEIDVIKAQMQRNDVEMRFGAARFVDSHMLCIDASGGSDIVSADVFLIAVGSMPARPDNIPFERGRIIDSDGILELDTVPRSMIIVGGGVIGVEYACTLAALGTRVTLIDQRPRLLEFIDAEIAEALQYHVRQLGVRLCLGEAVADVSTDQSAVTAVLESGKRLCAHSLLFAVGRQGATQSLDLDAAGLSADERGRLRVDSQFRTAVPHIYAAGDVIGFPALASTSAEQGRLASCHAFGQPCPTVSAAMPYGIYTIPEISMVGPTEDQLTRDQVPYEVGVARYREIARGQLLGDQTGMLKLIFTQDTRRLIAVHVIGEGATELVHIGQAVIALGGTVQYFVDNVFNYPTLAECYKVAALDGINRSAAAHRRATERHANRPNTETPSESTTVGGEDLVDHESPVPAAPAIAPHITRVVRPAPRRPRRLPQTVAH
ncbi:MAG: Si-specific NAD(P)(+) transhydrogenase [Phycisphaerales bacterium]|nr:Si-specific NAD(P)(+) transhydrogenase [Phycisphaerales bacterium]